MTTTAGYTNDLSSADAFALPTKSVFSVENAGSTSLSLLSSNADTHYSLGMSYMLLLSDCDDDEENIIMKKEWMYKSKLHLVTCGSVYCCMIGRICGVKNYQNPDDIGHVNIDGDSIGWRNFQEEGYLKTAFLSGAGGMRERKLLKVIKVLRERVQDLHSPNSHNDPILKDMKEMLNEIHETINSPDDSMSLLLSLSKMKAKVAVETEKRIKRESLEARRAKYRGHRARIPGATPKSQQSSMKNSQCLKTPGKRQRANTLSPQSSPQPSTKPNENTKSLLTQLHIPVSHEQEQNILSPAAFSKSHTPRTNLQDEDYSLKISTVSNEHKPNSDENKSTTGKKIVPNVNLWEIGSPIFKGAIGGDESLKVLKDSRKELRSPYSSLSSEKKLNLTPKAFDQQKETVSSTLWKNAPSSLKKKGISVPPSKRPKNSSRKKPNLGNVHANYDSKRHNRYRPMMKSNKKVTEVPKPKVVTPVKNVWNIPPKQTTVAAPAAKEYKPRSIIKKKSAIQNVRANYDSKRHNRYRPMIKPGKKGHKGSRNPINPITPPTKTLKHFPKGVFSLCPL